jgi:hypothetical protein
VRALVLSMLLVGASAYADSCAIKCANGQVYYGPTWGCKHYAEKCTAETGGFTHSCHQNGQRTSKGKILYWNVKWQENQAFYALRCVDFE